MLSIIIPSRSPWFLQKTCDDLIAKAEGEIEIIIVLDGIWPDPPIKDNPKIRIIHHGMQHDSFGMRESINRGMSLARGKYVMKIDEHCMMSQGYDVQLAANCEEDWVVIPRRKRLDAENWCLTDEGRADIDYNYITYPYLKWRDGSCGLHGAEWKRPERADIMIDDTVTCQGSFYYMHKDWWFDKIHPMNQEVYGMFINEAQEITLQTWLAGGRVIVNKNVFYAHYHKGSHGKGYGFSNAQYRLHQNERERGRKNCINYFMEDKYPKAIHSWAWLVDEKFPDMPGWGTDWKERLIIDKARENSDINI